MCLDGTNIDPKASVIVLVLLVAVNLLLNPLDGRLVGYEWDSSASALQGQHINRIIETYY